MNKKKLKTEIIDQNIQGKNFIGNKYLLENVFIKNIVSN